MSTLAKGILNFNASLKFTAPLPPGIGVMNPFLGNPEIARVTSLFYNKYYSSGKPRYMILGINPGRHAPVLRESPLPIPNAWPSSAEFISMISALTSFQACLSMI
ncbi:MAG: hypothetical protein UZ05_CHB002002111 [Chlorobi bacterium OLB5]|nr:MAG: hypothetical protein UZ05_CHB002002111 [Chlorobi bacterium OLB5]